MQELDYTFNCLKKGLSSLMAQRFGVFEADKGKPAGMRGRKAIGSQGLVPRGERSGQPAAGQTGETCLVLELDRFFYCPNTWERG